jgi:LuxR family maltose regulon positive regulatory protein
MADVPDDDGGVAMGAPLVAALLAPPGTASTIVSRPRLVQLIDAAARGPITIVSGEAAAGKTSLVADWINSTATDRPVAWMTVQPGLDDPILFWRYFVAAFEQLGAVCDDLALALADNESPSKGWLIALANRLFAVPGEPTIVLDDLHELQSAEARESLLAFLESTPATLHVLLLTRSLPPWQLTQWRVSGRLSEINSADLRFTHEEARRLIDHAELQLNDADLALLVDRTEGWAGGLRLAMLSMRHVSDPSAFVARFAVTDELVSSYLFREVLERQAPEVRAFLLDISILDRITPEVCDALRERNDSSELLERCRADSLFITEFKTPGVYHLHMLFGQLLRGSLDINDPDRLVLLHRRASYVFEDLGDVHTSIDHAVAARDFTRAGDLVTRHAGDFASRGRFEQIRSWLTLLPRDVKLMDPAVVIGLAMTLIICDNTGDALEHLDQLEAQDISPRTRYASNQARLTAFAINGSIEAAARVAAALDGEVPDGDAALPFEPARMAWFFQGLGAFFGSDLHKARALLERATERRDDPDVQYVESPGWLARVAHAEGELTESERHAHECLARNDQLGGAETAVVLPAYLALADVAWERNQLDEAETMLTRARRSVRPAPWLAMLVQISASRLLASRREFDEARQQLIECGQTHLHGDSSPLLRALLCETGVELALMADDVDDARRWERSYEACVDRPLPISLQLQLSAPIGPADAEAIVEQAVATKQTLPQEIDTLLASAALVGRAGADGRRNELVSVATHLAEPQGLIRRFLHGGAEVQRALRTIAVAPSSRGDTTVASQFFLESLISALKTDATGAPRPTRSSEVLVDPLTTREVQVLGLLAGGLQLADIGAELYVSRNTVKSHASHIYTKLGVSGRSQATEAGRRLGLV